MTIVLPWPDKRLFPNWKRAHHWRSYRPAEAQAREDGAKATYAALGLGLREIRAALRGDGKIAMTITFYPPDRRHRDDDGMIGAFKNWRDGIADALGVDDRRFRPHYFFEDAEKPGRIEVSIPCVIPTVEKERGVNALQNDVESASESAGQKGGCNANPALTENAITERLAMAPTNPVAGGLQSDSGGAP